VAVAVTANGTPDRRGFFLGMLLGGGALGGDESNTPIASARRVGGEVTRTIRT
jgi:hypothetical protein